MVVFSPFSSWYFFDRETDAVRERKISRQKAKQTEREPLLLCAQCGHTITRKSDRITVSNAFEHWFLNPQGVEFHIACFQQAPGCRGIGGHTTDWTWFSGYAWQIVVCQQCQNHLGWHYQGSDYKFYGLILKQLRAT